MLVCKPELKLMGSLFFLCGYSLKLGPENIVYMTISDKWVKKTVGKKYKMFYNVLHVIQICQIFSETKSKCNKKMLR